jgi:hypothetical protein
MLFFLYFVIEFIRGCRFGGSGLRIRERKSAHYHHHGVLSNKKKFKEHLNVIYQEYIVASPSSPSSSCNIHSGVTIHRMYLRVRRLYAYNLAKRE